MQTSNIKTLTNFVKLASLRMQSITNQSSLEVGEIMIRYNGMDCLIWQYMPNKLEKWGLKVWCFTCFTFKYVWNFEVYCGNECLSP